MQPFKVGVALAMTSNHAAVLRVLVREKCAVESNLNREIPLGFPSAAARTESGPTGHQYFQAKHGPHGPGHGRFWRLHLTASAPWEKR
jgi:hypothetical protein